MFMYEMRVASFIQTVYCIHVTNGREFGWEIYFANAPILAFGKFYIFW